MKSGILLWNTEKVNPGNPDMTLGLLCEESGLSIPVGGGLEDFWGSGGCWQGEEPSMVEIPLWTGVPISWTVSPQGWT